MYFKHAMTMPGKRFRIFSMFYREKAIAVTILRMWLPIFVVIFCYFFKMLTFRFYRLSFRRH